MKKGQVYEGVIESVEFPNKGIVNVLQEDRCVIVKNGVPGQKVRFSVNKVKKGKAEGRYPGGNRESASGDRTCLSAFRTVRRLHLSESAL